MKKKTIIIFLVMTFMGFVALSFAQPPKASEVKTQTIRGEIVSIDTANNQIVIKEANTGVQKTIVAEPKTIASLKVGERIKAEVKAGSSKAENIKVVKPKKAKK